MDLLEDAKQNKHLLSTGCEGYFPIQTSCKFFFAWVAFKMLNSMAFRDIFFRIDMLLGGGLREGQLTELVGPSSSGKTQVQTAF